MKQKHGMNPVTLRQKGRRSPITATLMRMGLGTEDNMQHVVTIALGNEEAEKVLGLVQVTQDQFIDAVGRLFPRGELDGANMEEGSEDKMDLLKELAGLEDLTRDGAVPFPSQSAYHTAMARRYKIKEILVELGIHVGLFGAAKELVRCRFMDQYGHLVVGAEFGVTETLSVQANDAESQGQLPKEFEGFKVDASTGPLPA